MLKNFQTILTNLNVQPLLDALKENEHLWNQNTLRTTHEKSPHKEVDDIWIRFNDLSKDVREAIEDKETMWYPAAFVLPTSTYIFTLAQLVAGDRFGRCVITRTPPGHKIDRHVDYGSPVAYYQRFHIALQNEEGAAFICGDEEFTPQAGDVFVFDNSKEHEVVNNSSTDRITMIVDIHTKCFEHIKPTFTKVVTKNPLNKEYGEGYTYQIESFEENKEEFEPFVMKHWNELGLTKDDVPIDFDWERFFKEERVGRLHTATVRKDGKLVGYHISFIGGHPHYKSTLHAMVDLYYLLPEERAGRVGLKMFQYVEDELRKLGVKKVYTGCKVMFDHTKLFTRLGYELSDYQFIKIL